MKYIIYDTGLEVKAIVFSEELIHEWVSRCLRGDGWRGEPLSAGFCYFSPEGGVRIEGRSESMNLDGCPEDADIIAKDYGRK